jgi:hypothetical protein
MGVLVHHLVYRTVFEKEPLACCDDFETATELARRAGPLARPVLHLTSGEVYGKPCPICDGGMIFMLRSAVRNVGNDPGDSPEG